MTGLKHTNSIVSTEIKPLEPQYFECACHSAEHTLRFVWDDEDNSIYTEVFLGHHNNIFGRIWNAIKYVFGYQCRYGHFDCFLMRPEDANRLQMLLDKIRTDQGA